MTIHIHIDPTIRSRALLLLLLLIVAAAACGKKPDGDPATNAAPVPSTSAPAPVPAPAPAAPTASAPATAAAPAAPPPPAEPPLVERPGGPTIAACTAAADHLASIVVDSLQPSDMDQQKRAYVAQRLKAGRSQVLRFCVETATQPEIDCVVASKDFAALAGCERFRHQIPAEVLKHDEVTPEDCEKFFSRLKQFKMAEGVPADRMEKDRDQIVRACEEKARPGTIACFLAARSYAEARLCP